MILFAAFVLSTFLTMMLIPPLIRWAGDLQLVDIPNERKVHVNAIPRIGGIAMFVGCLVSIAIWLDIKDQFIWVVVSFLVIVLFGIMDDRMELKYGTKFLGQILAAMIAVVLGDVQIKYLPFVGVDEISAMISIPLTVFCLLAITNAMNLVDGLDGLAGGAMLLVFGVVCLLGYRVQSLEVTVLSVAVMGSILGFLRFNTHPAMVFMGDCGSQFLGFIAGVIVVMLYDGNGGVTLSPALPLLLLGLPVLDTSTVMIKRMKEGRSPFSPDKNHIHHRLLAQGMNHFEAVFTLYVLQSVFAISAFLLKHESDVTVVTSYIVLCFLVMVFVKNVESLKITHLFSQQKKVSGSVIRISKDKLAIQVILISLPLYFSMLFLSEFNLENELPLFALSIVLIYAVISIINWNKDFGWSEKGIIYVGYSLAVFLFHKSNTGTHFVNPTYLIILTTLIVLAYRYSKTKKFEITTLDFLVVFLAILIQSVSQVNPIYEGWGREIVKATILFYTAELLMSGIYTNLRLIRVSFFAQFCILCLVLNV